MLKITTCSLILLNFDFFVFRFRNEHTQTHQLNSHRFARYNLVARYFIGWPNAPKMVQTFVCTYIWYVLDLDARGAYTVHLEHNATSFQRQSTRWLVQRGQSMESFTIELSWTAPWVFGFETARTFGRLCVTSAIIAKIRKLSFMLIARSHIRPLSAALGSSAMRQSIHIFLFRTNDDNIVAFLFDWHMRCDYARISCSPFYCSASAMSNKCIIHSILLIKLWRKQHLWRPDIYPLQYSTELDAFAPYNERNDRFI